MGTGRVIYFLFLCMGFFRELFRGKQEAAPNVDAAAAMESMQSGKVGDTAVENAFLGESTPELDAWNAQQAETASRAADTVRAAEARRAAIDAAEAVLVDGEEDAETIVRGDESEFGEDKAA